jgi:signal transduction histidine kinase
MFKKATLKLTGVYLGILMLISLAFSFSLYQVSIREINQGLNRQNDVIMNGPRFRILLDDPSDLLNRQQVTVEDSKAHVLANLIVINIGILVAGGFLSYYLARRTLGPIEEAHFAQVRFAADASHELRTPIATMQTETEVTLMDPNLDLATAKQQLASNLEELAKLTALSEGLLRLARLENADFEKETVELKEVTEQAIARVEDRAINKNIRIVSRLKSVTVSGDEASLVEALVTVLDNAIKYSPPKTEVVVKILKIDSEAKITVKDQGVGISKEDLPHIFERFYRADTARSKNEIEGYGLGLSIAKNVINLHHGSIEATSQPDSGTTITIKLPIEKSV